MVYVDCLAFSDIPRASVSCSFPTNRKRSYGRLLGKENCPSIWNRSRVRTHFSSKVTARTPLSVSWSLAGYYRYDVRQDTKEIVAAGSGGCPRPDHESFRRLNILQLQPAWSQNRPSESCCVFCLRVSLTTLFAQALSNLASINTRSLWSGGVVYSLTPGRLLPAPTALSSHHILLRIHL